MDRFHSQTAEEIKGPSQMPGVFDFLLPVLDFTKSVKTANIPISVVTPIIVKYNPSFASIAIKSLSGKYVISVNWLTATVPPLIILTIRRTTDGMKQQVVTVDTIGTENESIV